MGEVNEYKIKTIARVIDGTATKIYAYDTTNNKIMRIEYIDGLADTEKSKERFNGRGGRIYWSDTEGDMETHHVDCKWDDRMYFSADYRSLAEWVATNETEHPFPNVEELLEKCEEQCDETVFKDWSMMDLINFAETMFLGTKSYDGIMKIRFANMHDRIFNEISKRLDNK